MRKKRSSHLIKRRNALIYEWYCELWGQGLREELIWPKLSDVFFLEENTLYRIVLDQTKMTQKNQLDLFEPTENESK